MPNASSSGVSPEGRTWWQETGVLLANFEMGILCAIVCAREREKEKSVWGGGMERNERVVKRSDACIAGAYFSR